MFGTHDLWLFSATVFVLNATPGVDLLLILARTMQHGARGGLAAAFGVSVGCVLHALGAAFGLAALLAASAAAFSAVKWVGAAYLLWLAIGLLRSASQPGAAVDAASRSNPPTKSNSSISNALTANARNSNPPGPTPGAANLQRLFRQGLLTNALNPKVALFFLALLPQFIDSAAAEKTLAFLFLGAWFVVQGTLFLVAFVLLVAPLARWRPSTTTLRTLHGLGGTVFVALAAKLALAERH